VETERKLVQKKRKRRGETKETVLSSVVKKGPGGSVGKTCQGVNRVKHHFRKKGKVCDCFEKTRGNRRGATIVVVTSRGGGEKSIKKKCLWKEIEKVTERFVPKRRKGVLIYRRGMYSKTKVKTLSVTVGKPTYMGGEGGVGGSSGKERKGQGEKHKRRKKGWGALGCWGQKPGRH